MEKVGADSVLHVECASQNRLCSSLLVQLPSPPEILNFHYLRSSCSPTCKFLTSWRGGRDECGIPLSAKTTSSGMWLMVSSFFANHRREADIQPHGGLELGTPRGIYTHGVLTADAF